MTLKISVLTPCYDAVGTIERAIKSVIDQHYPNFEHIIIDGGSKDGTINVIKKYDHVTWISEVDKGQSDAMNKAFLRSSGDIIVYLNADDWFTKNTFNQVNDYFQSNQQCNFLVGDLIKVFEDQNMRDTPSTRLFDILQYWPCNFPLNPVSYFYRREVQERIGLFPVENHYTMDYWFLLRAYRQVELNYIPEVFGYFQLFDNKSSDIDRTKCELRKVRNEFLIEFPLTHAAYRLKKLTTKLNNYLSKLY